MMRLWDFNYLWSKLRLMWDRITFSQLTTVYFAFSVIHFVTQIALQSKALSINAAAASLLSSILVQGNISTRAFPVLGNELRLCDHVPSSLSADSCTIVWDGTPHNGGWLGPASNSTAATPTIGAVTASQSDILAVDSISLSSMSSSIATSVQTTQTTTTFTMDRAVTTTALPPFVTPSASTAPCPGPSHIGHISSDEDRLSGGYYDGNSYTDHLTGKQRRRSTDIDNVQAFQGRDGQVEVVLNGLSWNNTPALLDSDCLWALIYPVNVLVNTKREDIVFIAFQFWLLGISTVALLNESIPHILASLLTHMSAAAWAVFQIKHTSDFHSQFARLTTNGACMPLNMLPHYWKERSNIETTSMIMNSLALLASSFLTWRLVKLFGWQTFKRVGASFTINHVYKMVLTFSITIQLSLFFMVVTVALWIDQLFNGKIAQHTTLYKVMFTGTLVLLVPWLMTGWFAVRRELRIPMTIFLVLSVGYLAGWAIMFLSLSFRWTFVQWRFFSLMAIASVVLTLAALVLGVMCRVNFGKGLPHYLNGQHSLPEDDFVRASVDTVVDPEKIYIPSDEIPIPIFSMALGSGAGVPPPPPSYIRFAPCLGPRFHNLAAAPFDFRGNLGNRSIANPAPIHMRNVSDASCRTHKSDQSSGNESVLAFGINTKRWVIE